MDDLIVDLRLRVGDILLATTAEKLQKMINSLQMWCEKWKIKVSKSKTQIVHFRTKRSKKTSYAFGFCDDVIEIVEGY